MYGMKKTTVYLQEELKRSLELTAAEAELSEAELIRQAIAEKVGKLKRPRPKVPLCSTGLGDPTIAERVDSLLDGFGES